MCVACYVDEAAKEVVTLLFLEREVSEPHKLSGRCDCGPPCGHRHGAKRAVRVGGDEMALDVEGVVDGGVCGKKFLGRPRALEPASCAPAAASADANSQLDCSSIARAHADDPPQALEPRRRMIAGACGVVVGRIAPRG